MKEGYKGKQKEGRDGNDVKLDGVNDIPRNCAGSEKNSRKSWKAGLNEFWYLGVGLPFGTLMLGMENQDGRCASLSVNF